MVLGVVKYPETEALHAGARVLASAKLDGTHRPQICKPQPLKVLCFVQTDGQLDR